MSRQRGFALLIVLWLLVPLAVLFALLSGSARSDSQLAGNLRDAAALETAAEGGVETGIFALLDHHGATPFVVRLADADVSIRITSLSGLVNPNIASPELLRALLVRLGTEPARAERVAAAIVDWRTPGQVGRPNGAKAAEYRADGRDYGPPGVPFHSLAEVGDVLGVSPAMVAALLPYLTLYTERDPVASLAPPAVAGALGDLGRPDTGREDAGVVFQITAVAEGRGGGQAVRRATVKLGFSANRRAWRVLAWDAVPSPF